MSHLLTPQIVVGYLELIYLDTQAIESVLRHNWAVVAQPGERRLTRRSDAAGAGFEIRYQGESPWFQKIDLTDRGREQMISIQILGQVNAVPE